MTTPSIFVGTPVHNNSPHLEYMAGALSMPGAFPGAYQIQTEGGSFLPKQRDSLTRKFFDSGCSHFLCVDSDIGWNAGHVQRLLEVQKPFVSGIYCKKNTKRELPFSWNGERCGDLLGCHWAPGGFLLIAREVIEQMYREYAAMRYTDHAGTEFVALWAQIAPPQGKYSAEDVSFCKRWTALGGEIWAHPEVVLRHHGESVYVPNAGWETEL